MYVFKELATFILILLAGFSGLCSLAFWADSAACTQYADQTGRQAEYRFPSGCYIRTRAGWMTPEEFKATLVARDGLMKGLHND